MATRGRWVSAPGEAVLVREMGYSVDEFEAVLPSAMRDWSLRGTRPDWQVADSAGQLIARIHVDPLAERRLGALCLPVLRVRIDLTAASTGKDEFLRRFERGFHRGGG